jgi:AbiV family abortive infection protein
MKKVYEDAARAAYTNSLNLLEEANILYKNSKYARSYALSVLSTEEFVKAFLYKCISVGLITDPEFKRDIRSHQEKIYHVTHLFGFIHLGFKV